MRVSQPDKSNEAALEELSNRLTFIWRDFHFWLLCACYKSLGNSEERIKVSLQRKPAIAFNRIRKYTSKL